MPGPHDLVAKVLQLPNIPRDAVVGKVTIEYRSQPGVLFAGRQVPMGPAPVTVASERANRFLAVVCRTTFLPFRDFAQEWVKPRKSNEWALQSGGVPP